MKKLSIFSVAIAAVAVCSAAEVTSANTIGVQQLTLDRTVSLISVPWNAMTGSGPVSVSTLINPDQFNNNADVRLYVPNGDNYAVYKIVDNAWTGVGTTTIGANGMPGSVSGSAADKTLDRGSAIWLSVPESLKTATCCQVGEYTNTSVEVTLAQGFNLIASPKAGTYNLAYELRGSQDGDMITLPGVDKADLTLKRKGDVWKYQKNDKGVTSWVEIEPWDSRVSVPAGRGFWYYSKAGGSITL